MVSCYRTVGDRISRLDAFEKNAWVNMVEPTPSELESVREFYGVESDFLRAALDEEESSRIEIEDTGTLIIIDVPIATHEGKNTVYSTLPLGIILTSEVIITVSLLDTQVIREFYEGLIKDVHTSLKTRFVFQILLRVAKRYLQYLRQIDKMSVYIEKQLHKSMKNQELIHMLGLQKSLVYFSKSLKADEVTIEKLSRGRVIKLYEDDQELLEDVLIEIKQAIDMATIYSDIMAGTMNAFASVISNNLSLTMKVLTSITILMTIPNIVFGFYGMNVPDLPAPFVWAPLTITVIAIGITAFILNKKNLF